MHSSNLTSWCTCKLDVLPAAGRLLRPYIALLLPAVWPSVAALHLLLSAARQARPRPKIAAFQPMAPNTRSSVSLHPLWPFYGGCAALAFGLVLGFLRYYVAGMSSRYRSELTL